MAVIIEPWKVPPDGDHIIGEEPGDVLDLEREHEIRPLGPVRYDLTVSLVSEELLVTGSAEARVSFVCSRCGTSFDATVREEAFTCSYEVLDRYKPVDLTPDIRESIILHFPTYPMCAVECRGLCSTCGANLNKAVCGCPPGDDTRWGAFDKLKLS